jgi:hypothetical protein
MHGRVAGELGMKCGHEYAAITHEHRPFAFTRKHFYFWAGFLDPRRANENHLQRLGLQFRWSAAYFARQLPPIGIPRDDQVREPQRLLRGSAHLAREQNRTGASAEERRAARVEGTQSCLEPFFLQKLQHGGALAARQDHGVHLRGLFRRAHQHVIDAQPLEHACVRLVIALHSKYPDFHASFRPSP